MAASRNHKIIVAETAPIIMRGIVECLKKIKDTHITVIEVDTKASLIDTVSTENISLLIVNPTFGGLLHPDDIRKSSLNSEIKIFAIEISKIAKATLSLYDNHLHITEDFESLNTKIKTAINENFDDTEEKESLSIREKEVISYVVKGFTNQEIADKLFLSVHTVITHRRNIARKLQIHSATGLTIYAIVNKIVDLSDIKL